ncbi:MAG: protein tyrosine phosphatase [Pseudomonadota bacterium]
MLIVSSLNDVKAAFERHAPARVISLLSEDEEMPEFPGLGANAHLKLFAEHDSRAATMAQEAVDRVSAIIDFIGNWDGDGDLLVHCNRGVSRSTAVAYIVMCMLRADKDEATIAAELRTLAPHADPCLMLVSMADDLLDRDGRMIDAIENLCPPCTSIEAPILTLPLAA